MDRERDIETGSKAEAVPLQDSVVHSVAGAADKQIQGRTKPQSSDEQDLLQFLLRQYRALLIGIPIFAFILVQILITGSYTSRGVVLDADFMELVAFCAFIMSITSIIGWTAVLLVNKLCFAAAFLVTILSMVASYHMSTRYQPRSALALSYFLYESIIFCFIAAIMYALCQKKKHAFDGNEDEKNETADDIWSATCQEIA